MSVQLNELITAGVGPLRQIVVWTRHGTNMPMQLHMYVSILSAVIT